MGSARRPEKVAGMARRLGLAIVFLSTFRSALENGTKGEISPLSIVRPQLGQDTGHYRRARDEENDGELLYRIPGNTSTAGHQCFTQGGEQGLEDCQGPEREGGQICSVRERGHRSPRGGRTQTCHHSGQARYGTTRSNEAGGSSQASFGGIRTNPGHWTYGGDSGVRPGLLGEDAATQPLSDSEDSPGSRLVGGAQSIQEWADCAQCSGRDTYAGPGTCPPWTGNGCGTSQDRGRGPAQCRCGPPSLWAGIPFGAYSKDSPLHGCFSDSTSSGCRAGTSDHARGHGQACSASYEAQAAGYRGGTKSTTRAFSCQGGLQKGNGSKNPGAIDLASQVGREESYHEAIRPSCPAGCHYRGNGHKATRFASGPCTQREPHHRRRRGRAHPGSAIAGVWQSGIAGCRPWILPWLRTESCARHERVGHSTIRESFPKTGPMSSVGRLAGTWCLEVSLGKPPGSTQPLGQCYLTSTARCSGSRLSFLVSIGCTVSLLQGQHIFHFRFLTKAVVHMRFVVEPARWTSLSDLRPPRCAWPIFSATIQQATCLRFHYGIRQHSTCLLDCFPLAVQPFEHVPAKVAPQVWGPREESVAQGPPPIFGAAPFIYIPRWAFVCGPTPRERAPKMQIGGSGLHAAPIIYFDAKAAGFSTPEASTAQARPCERLLWALGSLFLDFLRTLLGLVFLALCRLLLLPVAASHFGFLRYFRFFAYSTAGVPVSIVAPFCVACPARPVLGWHCRARARVARPRAPASGLFRPTRLITWILGFGSLPVQVWAAPTFPVFRHVAITCLAHRIQHSFFRCRNRSDAIRLLGAGQVSNTCRRHCQVLGLALPLWSGPSQSLFMRHILCPLSSV